MTLGGPFAPTVLLNAPDYSPAARQIQTRPKENDKTERHAKKTQKNQETDRRRCWGHPYAPFAYGP